MKYNKLEFKDFKVFEKVYTSLKNLYGSNIEKIVSKIDILKFGEEIVIVEKLPFSYTAKTYDDFSDKRMRLRKIVERMENEDFIVIKNDVKIKSLVKYIKNY